MKYLKLSLKIVLGLFVLALGGLAVFAALFDPNDYRDRVAELVRVETGRELVLAGPLHLSIFPWLAVEAENVALGNASGFAPEHMVLVRRASLELQMLPLLTGELRVGEIELDGLELFLARNADGRSNWDDLLALADKDAADEGVPESKETPGTSEPEVSAGFRIADFSLEGLQAADMHLVWDDQAADNRFELSDGALHVSGVRPGAPLDVEASFGFLLPTPKLSGRVECAGVLGFDLEKKQYALPRMTLAIRAEGAELPNGRCEASLAMEQVRADLERGTASAAAFTLLGYDAQISGSLSLRDLTTEPSASGVVELRRCNLRNVFSTLGIEAPVTSDPTALTAVGATLRFDYTPHQIVFPHVLLDLDGRNLEGGGAAHLDRPEYSFVLRSDQLDLDRYLPPKPQSDAVVTVSASQSDSVGEPAQKTLPVVSDGNATEEADAEWLVQAKKMALTAEVVLGKTTVAGMELSGLHLKMRALHGVIAADPLELILKRGDDQYRLVTGKLFGDLHKMGIRADRFELTAPGGGVSGFVSASNLLASPEASGKLSLDHLDLRRLALAFEDVLPTKLPETNDPKALTDLHGTIGFDYAPEQIDVPAFDLHLDGASLQGHFHMQAKPAQYDVALRADRLDVDRYLPPAKEAVDGGGATPAESAASKPDALDAGAAATHEANKDDPLARIRSMQADAQLDIGILQYQGLVFQNIKAGMRVRDGVAELDPFSLSLDEGLVDLSWRLDAKDEGANTLVATIRGLRLGGLLQRFAGISDAQGTLTLRTIEPLIWQGLDGEHFKRSFSGSAGFAVRDGQYPGLDLFSMLTVVDKLTSAVLEGSKDDSTKFGEATGTIVAHKGRVHLDDLCVKAPGLRAGGEGYVNLPDGKIEYLVRAMAVPAASGQGGAACDEYYGVPMPVRISGTLDNPRYWVSAEEYAASLARGAVGLLGGMGGVVQGVVGGGAQAVGTVLQGGANAAEEAAGGVVEGGEEVVRDAVQGSKEAVDDFLDGLKKVF